MGFRHERDMYDSYPRIRATRIRIGLVSDSFPTLTTRIYLGGAWGGQTALTRWRALIFSARLTCAWVRVVR